MLRALALLACVITASSYIVIENRGESQGYGDYPA